MPEISPTYENDINLLELIEALWVGKYLIFGITSVVVIIGALIGSLFQSTYNVTTPITPAQNSAFLEYTSLNQILVANKFEYAVNAENLFPKIVAEFNDYDELLAELENNEFVKTEIINLDTDEQRKALIEYAKLFKISSPKKNEDKWNISYNWHDAGGANLLLNNAMKSVLSKVKNSVLDDVEQLAHSIEARNNRQFDRLTKDLDTIEEIEQLRFASRIQFLNEQSAIAKELGIETNQVNAGALSNPQGNGLALNITSNEVPFYLRGSRAIEKEITLLENRPEEKRLLMAAGFIEIKDKIERLKSDLSAQHLRESLTLIKKEEPKNWINYNLELADVRVQNKWLISVLASLFLGIVLGAAAVLLKNAYRKRRSKKRKQV